MTHATGREDTRADSRAPLACWSPSPLPLSMHLPLGTEYTDTLRLHPMPSHTQDNVEQLLHVGDMYDMAVVRGYCVTFLTIHIPSLGLEVPLPSPKNLLRAATLVLKYGSLPDMTTCRTIVLSALQRALSPLSDAQSEAVLTCSGNHPAWSSKQLTPKYHCAYCKMDRERGASVPEKAKAAMRALQLVQRLVGQPDFHNVVSAEVQVRTSGSPRGPSCTHASSCVCRTTPKSYLNAKNYTPIKTRHNGPFLTPCTGPPPLSSMQHIQARPEPHCFLPSLAFPWPRCSVACCSSSMCLSVTLLSPDILSNVGILASTCTPPKVKT